MDDIGKYIRKISIKKPEVLVFEQIVDLIYMGKLKVGDQLPPVQAMREKFNISETHISKTIGRRRHRGVVLFQSLEQDHEERRLVVRPAGQVAERGDILLQLRRGVGQRVVRVHADADDVPPVGRASSESPQASARRSMAPHLRRCGCHGWLAQPCFEHCWTSRAPTVGWSWRPDDRPRGHRWASAARRDDPAAAAPRRR